MTRGTSALPGIPPTPPLVKPDHCSSQVSFQMPILEAFVPWHHLFSINHLPHTASAGVVWVLCLDRLWKLRVPETQFKLLKQKKSILTHKPESSSGMTGPKGSTMYSENRLCSSRTCSPLLGLMLRQALLPVQCQNQPPAAPTPFCQVRGPSRREHTSFTTTLTKVQGNMSLVAKP